MRTRIVKIGNSQGIRIPKALLEESGLKGEVDMSVRDGVLLITHYTRILRYIHPQFVHVFVDGRIVASGGPELADELEENGYVRFTERTTAAS